MLPEKEIERTKQDLIELHKRVLTDYLTREGLNHRNRVKFFHIYDYYISTDNILMYFTVPCKIFVRALIKDKLEQVKKVGFASDRHKRRKIKHKKIITF